MPRFAANLSMLYPELPFLDRFERAAQAVLDILLAAGIMLAYVVRKKHALSVGDLYDILFPIVAVALIALPFITSPIVHVIAAVLVFVAFYLSGMNVRIAVCLLGERDHVSMWVYLSVALGASALLILGGVAFGAAVIAQDVLVTVEAGAPLRITGGPQAAVKLADGRRIGPASFDVRAGEVVGLAGLVGRGELPLAEFGARQVFGAGIGCDHIADGIDLHPHAQCLHLCHGPVTAGPVGVPQGQAVGPAAL